MSEKTQVEPLDNVTLYKLGKFDKANRWYPNQDVAEYFQNIRSPSRAWPYSYWKAAKTKKFAKWYQEKISNQTNKSE